MNDIRNCFDNLYSYISLLNEVYVNSRLLVEEELSNIDTNYYEIVEDI